MNLGYKALAALLDYPSTALLDHLDEVRAAAEDLGPRAVQALQPLLDALCAADLLDAQETYVDTFDRGRRASLNLFEHVHGESRDRGQAMVDLLQMYRAAGLEPATDQLPDYLPAFLEYLSLLEAESAAGQLEEIVHILQSIHAVLAKRASPYAAIFDVLLERAGQPTIAEPAADDDGTPEAIDAAWAEAPVNFLDAPAPCGSSHTAQTQTIHVHRRAA